MRALTIALLAVGIAVGGCNRTETAPVGGGAPPDTSAAGPNAKPAATTGTVERSAMTRAEWHEVTIPAGTHLPVVLDTAVGSDTSQIEEPVHAHMIRPVVIRGQNVLPEGTRVSGVVTDARRSGRVKGRAHVAIRFDTLAPRGADERYTIRTVPVGRLAPATKKKDALEIAGPAAGGALIGAIIGGKKGALIGTAAGGGAGTAIVLSTRGKEIRLPKGAALTLRLSEPVTVRVRG